MTFSICRTLHRIFIPYFHYECMTLLNTDDVMTVCENEDELLHVEIDELFRRCPRINNQVRMRDAPELMTLLLDKVRVHCLHLKTISMF